MNDAQVLQAYQLFKDVLHSGAATCLSDEALDTLDRELLFAVSVIRTRINSSRRYAQLPAEILTAIFQHVLAPSTHFLSDSGSASPSEAPPDTRSLLAVSHVCTRWRAVSTTCTSLWAETTITRSQYLTTLFLERSGARPLRVFVDESNGSLGGTAEAFAPLTRSGHRERVREVFLSLSSRVTSSSNVLSKISTFSELMHFSLRVAAASGDVRVPMGTTVSARQFFTQITAEGMLVSPSSALHLRVLSISLLCGIFPTDTFPALVHLRIEGSRRYPIKIDMFLRFLSGTPLIETLHTSSVIPVQGAVFKAVSLPRIRVFSLTDIDDSVVSNISQDIIVPPEAMILLHHIRVRPNHVLWPSQFPLPVLDGITDLELAENGKQLHIRARGRCSAIWLHFSGTGFMLSHKILPIVLSQYSPLLSTVATVRIAVEPYSSLPNSLEHILPAVQEFCPATSTLIIASSPDEQPDHRSSVLRHDSGETRIAPLAFPAVENLHIQVSRPLLDQDIFLEMLRAHVIQGHPLASLTFSAPGGLAVADGDYSEFTKHVGRVESTATKLWDPEGDAFWRRRNEYWPLYPDAGDLKEAWGLPSVGAW